MKKMIAVLLATGICAGLCACGEAGYFLPYTNFDNQPKETQGITTNYPDDIARGKDDYITVEMAEADLREYADHECLEYGTVTFDKLSYKYPSLTDVVVVFTFDIVIQFDYGNENYRAKVEYGTRDGEHWVSNTDVWQLTSTFTKTGRWKYDDGETSISVNFIECNGNDYMVEYDISYYASYWMGSRWVVSSSEGATEVHGETEWDGENHYLSIDLGDFYNEKNQTMDRGYIKVYPWSGIYWNALHAKGGPFILEKQ